MKPSRPPRNETLSQSRCQRLFDEALLLSIAFYRAALSPHLGGACRYWPSCSAYAEQAIRVHGGLRGAILALARLSRCRPWGGRGLDPVPASEKQ